MMNSEFMADKQQVYDMNSEFRIKTKKVSL